MMQRFLSYGMFKKLELLEALDPVHVFESKSKSIIPSAVQFPNLVKEEENELIN